MRNVFFFNLSSQNANMQNVSLISNIYGNTVCLAFVKCDRVM